MHYYFYYCIYPLAYNIIQYIKEMRLQNYERNITHLYVYNVVKKEVCIMCAYFFYYTNHRPK